ncbi:MAG TPA: PAS domain S-box protein [Rariglobus sp.]|nr:PAS domain S-box protein [Rariglobus sp.]
MRLLTNLPIKRKLTIISMLTSGVVLLLTCAAFMTYEQVVFRRDMTHNLASIAEMIGVNSASALSFNDSESAAQTLKGLAAQPHIQQACIYDDAGKVFATYQRTANPAQLWPAMQPNSEQLTADALVLFRSINLTGDVIGTIYLQSDLDEMRTRWQRYALIASLVLLAAMAITWLIASKLQRIISEPVLQLAATAGRVAAERDYSVRVTKQGNDEVGRLFDGFNDMLAQIQTRDAELQSAHNNLEKRVEERTAALRTSEERIRLIVDTAFDAIITFDSNDRITDWNSQAENTFGWTRDEALGLNVATTLIAPQHREAYSQRLQRFLTTGDGSLLSKRIELTALRKDGQEFPAELAISPIQLGDTVLFSSFLRDTTESKRAEVELKAIHRQLLDTSRQAGMAEVATGVLHNVGNVLNSVNVSATLVADQVRRSKSPNVGKLSDLLHQHRTDLGDYLTNDPKGKIIPAYLMTLKDELAKEQSTILAELDSLHKNIGHIKDIVAMQQSYAKTSGVVETVSIPDLIEDAIRMNAGSLARHDVDVAREYHVRPVVTLEKNKALQILVNLVRNAKYACDESGRIDKLLTISTTADDLHVIITVSDNGVGIPAENLTRIFAHGFTTRKQGHGFGLHSGALAAKELGGSLTAHSDGPGLGASFTLTIPYRTESMDD